MFEVDFDVTKDYYSILGVGVDSTIDELKQAHIALALKYHPDSASTSSSKNVDNFKLVSEAWQVLSKPLIKSRYDNARRTLLGTNNYNTSYNASSADGDSNEGSSISYHTQKMNFENSVRSNASSTWRDKKDKYKTEQWQNLPLNDRKLSRRRPVVGPNSVLMNMLPYVALAFAGAATYTYTSK